MCVFSLLPSDAVPGEGVGVPVLRERRAGGPLRKTPGACHILDHLPSLPAGGCWPWASASSPRFPSHWEERVAQVVSSISASSSPGQASSLLLAFYSLHLHSASSPSWCLSLFSRLHPAQVFRSQNGWTELKGMVLRFLSWQQGRPRLWAPPQDLLAELLNRGAQPEIQLPSILSCPRGGVGMRLYKK